MQAQQKHQPYLVLSVDEDGTLGRTTKLHYRNPARAETSKKRLEETTGEKHEVFVQKAPGGPIVRYHKPVGATPCH